MYETGEGLELCDVLPITVDCLHHDGFVWFSLNYFGFLAEE